MGREHERKEKKKTPKRFAVLQLCFESVFFEFEVTFLVILNSRVAMLHSYRGAERKGYQFAPWQFKNFKVFCSYLGTSFT